MKNLNTYLLFFLGFIFLSFQFSQEEKINNSDKEKKLRELISKTKILELPIFLDVYQENKSAKAIGLSQLINPNNEADLMPVLGILPDTTNYVAFLGYGIGDVAYSMLYIFDKKGNLIENKAICLTDNLNIFEEVDINDETNTVRFFKKDRGTEITLFSSVKGKKYREFESNTENTNLTDSLFFQKIIQTGFLNEKGKVILDEKL